MRQNLKNFRLRRAMCTNYSRDIWSWPLSFGGGTTLFWHVTETFDWLIAITCACYFHLLCKWPGWKITLMALSVLAKICKFYITIVNILYNFPWKLPFSHILVKYWTLFIKTGLNFVTMAQFLPNWPKHPKNKWPVQIPTCWSWPVASQEKKTILVPSEEFLVDQPQIYFG